jgi:hypothetical protein
MMAGLMAAAPAARAGQAIREEHIPAAIDAGPLSWNTGP